MTGKLVSIVGARPNFVKLAAVEPSFKTFDHIIVHTGQHYDYEMSKVFFEHLDIPEPHYYLGVGSGTQGYQVGEMTRRVEEVLLKENPDMVVVYGDTNSTLAGALAAVKAGFKVAHVESGLRSYDMGMPEEINRVVTDHVSTLLFAPTVSAADTLLREEVPGQVHLTGDVHVDLLQRYARVAASRSHIVEELGLDEDYIVATVHRAENTDNPRRLRSIVDILAHIAEEHVVILPLHPRTRKALSKHGLLGKLGEHVKIVKPLGYLDFIALLQASAAVATDSGGVQREAFLLGKPSLVFRDRTEWVELAQLGWVRLVDVDRERAAHALESVLESPPKQRPPVLGRGDAAQRIADILSRTLA